jgi:hypothetical protein
MLEILMNLMPFWMKLTLILNRAEVYLEKMMKTEKKFLLALAFTLTLSLVQLTLARAGAGDCFYTPPDTVTCTTGGSGNNGEGGEGGNGGSGNEEIETEPCTEVAIADFSNVLIPASYFSTSGGAAPLGSCIPASGIVDTCSGNIFAAYTSGLPTDCPIEYTPPPNPCTTELIVTSSGVSCGTSWDWHLTASVRLPVISLDVRPYPATLVRWEDTAIRLGALPTNAGAGRLAYAALGGGSPGNPAPGDWRDIRLTLTFRPAQGAASVSLPHIGEFNLPLAGSTGNPMLFHWELPSHPEAGGGPLAGSVGLEELPADFPLFVGTARAPYRLYWDLRYQEWASHCEVGGGGSLNCGRDEFGNFAGHREWDWERRSSGGEISPSAVQGLPASMMADLDHNGAPDAYWDRSVQIRRMDNANRVDNPLWARTYSWGSIFYWGVREGQGQIGWQE